MSDRFENIDRLRNIKASVNYGRIYPDTREALNDILDFLIDKEAERCPATADLFSESGSTPVALRGFGMEKKA